MSFMFYISIVIVCICIPIYHISIVIVCICIPIYHIGIVIVCICMGCRRVVRAVADPSDRCERGV